MQRRRHLFPRARSERDDAPRLIPRFAVYAGLALVLAAGAGLLFARHNAADRAQRQVVADARFVAERLGRDDLAGSAFARPAGPDLRAQLDALFGGGLLGPGVLRATLLSPSGVVTYSTDHELIGRAGGSTDAVRKALEGAPVHDRGRLNDDGGHGANAPVLVSYVPVRWLLSGSQQPGGVLAVARDYRPVAKTIRRDFLLQAAVIALALLILYGALFPILRRVTATLAFRHRRLLEQARELRTSEQRYRTLTEQASDGILVRDLDGNYVEANEQACAMFGYSRDELLRLNVRDVIDDEELARQPLRTEELRAGETILHERVFRRADGSPLEVEVHARMLEDERILISIRDIAERRRAEAAMRQLAAVVGSTDDAVVATSRDGVVLSWNAGAERMYGWSADEMLGQPVDPIFPSDREDELPLLLERLWRGERITHYATARLRKDGTTIDVTLTLSPILDERGHVVAASGIARDVTERKRLGEQLRQAQRLDAVGRLAAGVASEFESLVKAIHAQGELLIAQLPAGPLHDEALAIRHAADRAAALTGQLLAFGGRQQRVTQIVDLNELVESCRPTLQALLGDRIELVTVGALRLGRVDADAAQLEHALLSLAANAREAMPGGGTLTIETTNVDLAEDVARAHLRLQPGRYVMLTVRDTGVGMDEATQQRIFDPFYTTKGDGKGLGLSTVYGVVEQSGGAIGVDSAPGHGAAFRMYLPRVEAAAEPLAHPDAGEPAFGDETVLVAEDDAIVRSLFQLMLTDHGYTVLVAENGSQALELTASHRGPIDLLITDIVMPDIGGRELAERVTALRGETSVIYTSGFPDQAMAGMGELEQELEFVQKPFTQETLARTVRGVLDRRSAAHEAEAIARRLEAA